MEKNLTHLLSDIAYATQKVSWPFVEQEIDIHDWLSPEEEDNTGPVRELKEWTGIRNEHLPPEEMLSNEQIHELLSALKTMLDAYNWSFVLQIEVPERIQYAALRDNFGQQAKVKRRHHGYLSFAGRRQNTKNVRSGNIANVVFMKIFFGSYKLVRDPHDLTTLVKNEKSSIVLVNKKPNSFPCTTPSTVSPPTKCSRS